MYLYVELGVVLLEHYDMLVIPEPEIENLHYRQRQQDLRLLDHLVYYTETFDSRFRQRELSYYRGLLFDHVIVDLACYYIYP